MVAIEIMGQHLFDDKSFKENEIYRFKDLEYGGKIIVQSADTSYLKLNFTERSS